MGHVLCNSSFKCLSSALAVAKFLVAVATAFLFAFIICFLRASMRPWHSRIWVTNDLVRPRNTAVLKGSASSRLKDELGGGVDGALAEEEEADGADHEAGRGADGRTIACTASQNRRTISAMSSSHEASLLAATRPAVASTIAAHTA